MIPYLIHTPTEAEFIAVTTQLRKEGFIDGVGPENVKMCFDTHGNQVTLRPRGTFINWCSLDWYEKENYPVLTAAQYAAVKGITIGPAPLPNAYLTVTRDYNARVQYADQVIFIGGQTIPFAKIEELFKLLPTQ